MENEALTLNDVCSFVGGSQPPKSSVSSIESHDYVQLIQIRDYKTDDFLTYIPKSSTRKFCSAEDVMIGRYGPPIFQILRGLTGAYNVALMKAIPKENINNDYLYYFLKQKHLFDYIDGLSPRTGGQTGVDVTMLKKYPIYLPKFDYQLKVVDILSNLDKKIELNNKINAELEAMGKLIYDYWFVQFDFPDANGKPYKSSGGSMVYNEALKHEIPEGWGSEYIENLLAKESRTKKLHKTHYKDQGDYAIIDQSTDFICGYTDDKDTVIEAKVPRIVFGDHTRILKLVNFDFARGADGTQVLLSNNNNVPQHFFYHSLLKIDLASYGYARHFKFLKQTRTIVPDANTANQFEEAATSFYSQVRHNIFETKRLEELRDWLLPMLMNGQVRVKS